MKCHGIISSVIVFQTIHILVTRNFRVLYLWLPDSEIGLPVPDYSLGAYYVKATMLVDHTKHSSLKISYHINQGGAGLLLKAILSHVVSL